MSRMFDAEEIRERVDKGASLLDEVKPGWFLAENVDITRVDMGDYSLCVLGWAFGDFLNGITTLRNAYHDGETDWSFRHGFDGSMEDENLRPIPDQYAQVYYDELRDVWLDVINERRWIGSIK